MALGFISGLAGAAIPALGATALYLIFRAVKSMKTGSQLGFQLQNLAVWLAMALSATAVEVFSPATNFTAALVCWIVVSVVGGLIVQFGPREGEPEDDLPLIVAGGE